MKDLLLRAIRSRSREGWRDLVFDRWTWIRIWVQEHGEKAALYALLLGIFLVVAFKLVVFCAILALLIGYVIYFVALPEEGARPEKASTPSGSELPGPDDGPSARE